MVKTKAPTPPPPAADEPASAQADEPYFEGQAAIAPEDVPSLSTAQQLSADDGGASAIPPAASDEASAPPPGAEAAPQPPSSSVETTPPAPSIDQLLSAKRVTARAKDPQSGGFYVGGELVTAEPREVDLRNIRRRSRAHLDKFLHDERIAFEIPTS